MAMVSSHILDSISGGSAVGIQVSLIQVKDNQREIVFDVIADNEGRISETIEADEIDPTSEYELVFFSADYFDKQPIPEDKNQNMRTVVVRFTMPDPKKRYHIPIMLSPHSYSVWWAK